MRKDETNPPLVGFLGEQGRRPCHIQLISQQRVEWPRDLGDVRELTLNPPPGRLPIRVVVGMASCIHCRL